MRLSRLSLTEIFREEREAVDGVPVIRRAGNAEAEAKVKAFNETVAEVVSFDHSEVGQLALANAKGKPISKKRRRRITRVNGNTNRIRYDVCM